jgi:hypothetical protein
MGIIIGSRSTTIGEFIFKIHRLFKWEQKRVQNKLATLSVMNNKNVLKL